MSDKTCFKCQNTFPLHFFYKHKKMKDGHLNKCKKCTKKDSCLNYRNNFEKRRNYDRQRNKNKKRLKDKTRYTQIYRKRNPEKYKAQNKVNNAIRDGKLKRKNCCICGSSNVHAHHENYDKPLEVIWVCPLHHKYIEQ